MAIEERPIRECAESEESATNCDEQQRAAEICNEFIERHNLITVGNRVVVPVKTRHDTKSITAAELDQMDIPPIQWIIDGILPVGLALLGAPSKYFKSYMALDISIAVSSGGTFLGFKCNKNGVLYLDLESTPRRPRDRIRQIMGENSDKLNNLHILTADNDVGRIGEGFEGTIQTELERHPDIRLIIVDVFQMIRQPAKARQSDYDRDYADFKVLKRIADSHGICLMLIHHTRKMKDPSDVFNNLSGSVGVMGALDCAWVISKEKRTDEEGTLNITGRDMESQELRIRFNKKTFRWEYIGTAQEVEDRRLMEEYNKSPVVSTIKKLVAQNNGHWEGSAEDIKAASQYFGFKIYDDARQVGRLISKYDALLIHEGRIETDITRTSKNRKYVFNVIHV